MTYDLGPIGNILAEAGEATAGIVKGVRGMKAGRTVMKGFSEHIANIQKMPDSPEKTRLMVQAGEAIDKLKKNEGMVLMFSKLLEDGNPSVERGMKTIEKLQKGEKLSIKDEASLKNLVSTVAGQPGGMDIIQAAGGDLSKVPPEAWKSVSSSVADQIKSSLAQRTGSLIEGIAPVKKPRTKIDLAMEMYGGDLKKVAAAVGLKGISNGKPGKPGPQKRAGKLTSKGRKEILGESFNQLDAEDQDVMLYTPTSELRKIIIDPNINKTLPPVYKEMIRKIIIEEE